MSIMWTIFVIFCAIVNIISWSSVAIHSHCNYQRRKFLIKHPEFTYKDMSMIMYLVEEIKDMEEYPEEPSIRDIVIGVELIREVVFIERKSYGLMFFTRKPPSNRYLCAKLFRRMEQLRGDRQ